MAQFVVEGGSPISGSITPSGNKNEALPVIAATLLSREKIRLTNVPGIGDVRSMLQLVELCGAKVTHQENHTVEIQADAIELTELPAEISSKIRASILFLAPILSRCGRVRLPFPGGDRIGRRRVDTHLLGLQALGATMELEDGFYHLWSPHRLKGTDILMDEASVTATENLVMAAVLAEGRTVLHNAASEPHVQQLCQFLNHLGAKISGIGSNVITIDGVEELNGGEHRIGSDYLEVGSFIGCAIATGGELTIHDAAPEHMRMTLHKFESLGMNIEVRGNDMFIPKDQPKKTVPDLGTSQLKIDDGPWPLFPADMMSVATVMATQMEGTVMIFEKMFESRLFFVDRLMTMGANIILCDPHRAVVIGPTQLKGQVMSSPDIRAGMALLIAALCAEGKSIIQNIEQIDRGYERLDERLSALGAKISRED